MIKENPGTKINKKTNFEAYMKESIEFQWENKYFPYSQIKKDISEEYQKMLNEIAKDAKNKNKKQTDKQTDKQTIINFGKNSHFNLFLEKIEKMIFDEFSKVKNISTN